MKPALKAAHREQGLRIEVNEPPKFTAAITARVAVPDGAMVTFYNGATKIGAGNTANGAASLTTSFSEAKTYTITAFHGARSGRVKQIVKP